MARSGPSQRLLNFTAVRSWWHNSSDEPPDERYENIRIERSKLPKPILRRHDTDGLQVDDYPPGYPQLAAVVNSDPNFRVYRRFGTLRNRVMFYRQHEIAKLEEKLQEMDKADDQAHPYRNQSIRKDKADPESERQALMDEIDQKLEHYGTTQVPTYWPIQR